MRSPIGIGEAADLFLLIVHQPADTVLWCMAIDTLAVLFQNGATMASDAVHRAVLRRRNGQRHCGEIVLGVPVLLGVSGWDQLCKIRLDKDKLKAVQQATKAISDATHACRRIRDDGYD